MSQVNVISVNPSTQTLGALNIESIEGVARSYNPNSTSISFPGLKTLCNFVFGLNKSITTGWSKKLAVIRTLSATLFIAASMSLRSVAPFGHSLAIAAVIFGAMIFVGFFERLASIAASVFSVTVAAHAIPMMTTTPQIADYLLSPSILLSIFAASIMLIVSILGPGRFSVDHILNRIIYKFSSTQLANRRERNRRQEAEMRLSYKAWRSSM